MKLYRLHDKVYQEPLSKDFDFENAVEITSPIKEDGTIWDTHPDKSILETKKDGSFFKYYLPNGKADTKRELSETTKQLISQVKVHRDSLISQVEWRRTRHQDEVSLGLEPTEPLLPILEYIQALRDVPSQAGFPETISWPEAPNE